MALMSHTHCTGSGRRRMGFYITLCTVHTARDQDEEGWVSILHYVLYTLHGIRTKKDGFLYYTMYCTHCTGSGPRRMGFYITLCTVHTARDQDEEGWVSILHYVLYTLHGIRTKKDGFLYYTMYCTHCTGSGRRRMGFYITLCTVHTTQGQGMMGFYITLCTVHTARDQDEEGWVSILHYVLYTLHRDRE